MMKHVVMIALVAGCSTKDKAAEESAKEYAKATAKSDHELAAIATAEPKKLPAPQPLSASKPRPLDGFTPAEQIDVPDDVVLTYHKSLGKDDPDAAVLSWHSSTIYISAGTFDPAARKAKLKGTVEEKSDANGWVLTAIDGGNATVEVYRSSVHALCTAMVPNGDIADLTTLCSTLRAR